MSALSDFCHNKVSVELWQESASLHPKVAVFFFRKGGRMGIEIVMLLHNTDVIIFNNFKNEKVQVLVFGLKYREQAQS
ncbi:hypothetical protein HUO09_14305 [Vibrio sp. Y2-5]|uniref:hypothetical protein n=1 Tax=Vibrio sp. Y2-5 TaxID=2743977 RepID=UPI0016616E33|nr:hypothetical protein [Vibrio sp. Y2-5]MBD0787519.1 hypothetical protein [Vibrio sp. Y2-5]